VNSRTRLGVSQNSGGPLKEVMAGEAENRSNSKIMVPMGLSNAGPTYNHQIPTTHRRSKVTKLNPNIHGERYFDIRKNSMEKGLSKGVINVSNISKDENKHKNRPQTSYRVATKNSFGLIGGVPANGTCRDKENVGNLSNAANTSHHQPLPLGHRPSSTGT
jgi:hypothetical protein